MQIADEKNKRNEEIINILDKNSTYNSKLNINSQDGIDDKNAGKNKQIIFSGEPELNNKEKKIMSKSRNYQLNQ